MRCSEILKAEAVFGNLPDLSNLWVLRCQMFSHVDKSRQHKLSPKAIEGVFVGYASGCPAWLVYNPTTRSITRKNSAVFNERWKPARQYQKQKPPNEVSIKASRSSSKEQFTSLSPLFPTTNCISDGCTPDTIESCVSSLSFMHPTFSSNIQGIIKITYSTERQDYVLDLFEKMEDANFDHED